MQFTLDIQPSAHSAAVRGAATPHFRSTQDIAARDAAPPQFRSCQDISAYVPHRSKPRFAEWWSAAARLCIESAHVSRQATGRMLSRLRALFPLQDHFRAYATNKVELCGTLRGQLTQSMAAVPEQLLPICGEYADAARDAVDASMATAAALCRVWCDAIECFCSGTAALLAEEGRVLERVEEHASRFRAVTSENPPQASSCSEAVGVADAFADSALKREGAPRTRAAYDHCVDVALLERIFDIIEEERERAVADQRRLTSSVLNQQIRASCLSSAVEAADQLQQRHAEASEARFAHAEQLFCATKSQLMFSNKPAYDAMHSIYLLTRELASEAYIASEAAAAIKVEELLKDKLFCLVGSGEEG